MTDKELIMMALITLKNVVAIICFSILAVIFECFWFVLFALLFMSSVSYKTKE